MTHILEEDNCVARYLILREDIFLACNTKDHIVHISSDLHERSGCLGLLVLTNACKQFTHPLANTVPKLLCIAWTRSGKIVPGPAWSGPELGHGPVITPISSRQYFISDNCFMFQCNAQKSRANASLGTWYYSVTQHYEWT